MNSKIVKIAGNEYLARYPVGALILAEKALGWNLSQIDQKRDDMSFSDLCTVVRYGIHHTNGHLITDDEFSALLDSLDVAEFNQVVPEILSVFNSSDSSSSGNPSTKN